MLGELHDTCNDLCRSVGKNGCNAGKMAEINRIPRATRLLKALGFQCASASSRTFGPTYQPGNEICRYGSGQVDCDQNDLTTDRPLCFCSTEILTPAPLAACWQHNVSRAWCDMNSISFHHVISLHCWVDMW